METSESILHYTSFTSLHQTVKECLKNMVADSGKEAVSKDDLRIFAGVQEGDAVVVREQRIPKEPRASVIVQSENRTRVIWHRLFQV